MLYKPLYGSTVHSFPSARRAACPVQGCSRYLGLRMEPQWLLAWVQGEGWEIHREPDGLHRYPPATVRKEEGQNQRDSEHE